MTTSAIHHHDHHQADSNSKVIFGFWLFVLSDCILFAALFATYVILHPNTYGGISIHDVTNLHFVLAQTLVMLTSSFTLGLGVVALKNNAVNKLIFWLVITFLLGATFVGLEWHQFAVLVHNGHTWQSSAFLSSFFTLLGFQAAHLTVALFWILVVIVQLKLQKINPIMRTRLSCLSLFWDFLNLVWIFIFTVVYLMGAIHHV